MNRKRITGWLLIALGLIQIGGGVLLARAAGIGEAELADANLIRIHVIAHSDAPEEQSLKLAVRDAVLERLRPAVSGARSRAEAEAAIRTVLGDLEAAAGAVVAAWGRAHPVRAELGTFAFPGKGYDGLYLPAGKYRALRILIGDAAGANFWCLVYPSFCYTIREVQAPAGTALAAGGPSCPGGCPAVAGDACQAACGGDARPARAQEPCRGTCGDDARPARAQDPCRGTCGDDGRRASVADPCRGDCGSGGGPARAYGCEAVPGDDRASGGMHGCPVLNPDAASGHGGAFPATGATQATRATSATWAIQATRAPGVAPAFGFSPQ